MLGGRNHDARVRRQDPRPGLVLPRAEGLLLRKGESGAEPHKIDCDDGVAQEGDPCAQPRRITCALDHKEELVCDGHKFGKKRDCRRSDCRIDGTELFCD